MLRTFSELFATKTFGWTLRGESCCSYTHPLLTSASAKAHMEPLAISSLILQSPTLRLDQVLLTLGNLYRIYTASHVDLDVRDAIVSSLEKRWKAADQEIFILAVVFNPYIRNTGFCDAYLSRAELLQMCTRAFKRFFRRDATMDFWRACQRYLNSEERFSVQNFSLDQHRRFAEQEVRLWSLIVP